MGLKQWAIAVATGLVLFATGWLAGRLGRPTVQEGSTRVLLNSDTLVVRTALHIDKPELVVARVTDTLLVAVTDTVRLRDTIYLHLPREEKLYEGTDYRAQVSGYRPELDWIEVFPETKTITNDFVTSAKSKRWGIGMQLGGSVTYSNGLAKLFPYVGIGISYNLIMF